MARNLKRRERQQSPCFSKWCYASPHSEHLTSFLIHTLSSLNQSSLLIIKIIMKGNGPRQPKDISPSCLPCPAPWKSLPSQRKPQSEDGRHGRWLQFRAEEMPTPAPNGQQHLIFPLVSDYRMPGNSKKWQKRHKQLEIITQLSSSKHDKSKVRLVNSVSERMLMRR